MVPLVEGVEPDRVAARAPPEPQGVHFLAAPPEDRRVVGDGVHGFAGLHFVARRPVPAFAHGHGPAEADLVIGFAPLEFPRIAEGEPIFGVFDLPAVRDGLAEQAEIVTDAVAERRDADRRHALHEASREAPKAAVAERGIGLEFRDRIEIDGELLQRGSHRLRQAETAQRLLEQTADEEFERKVVDALAAGLKGLARRGHPAVDDAVAHGKDGGEQPIVILGHDRVLADRIGELCHDLPAKRVGIVAA